MDALLHITQRWLQPQQLTVVEIVERVTLDRFLRALPDEERRAVVMKATTTPRSMIMALECVLATLDMGRGERREKSLDWWQEFSRHRGPPLTSSAWAQEELQVRPSPVDEALPTEPEQRPPPRVNKTWLAGCTVHDAP